MVGGPGQVARGGDDGVELVLVHQGVDALFAVAPLDVADGVQVDFVGQGAPGLGRDHALLSEVGHLQFGVLLVELDDLRQGAHGCIGSQ